MQQETTATFPQDNTSFVFFWKNLFNQLARLADYSSQSGEIPSCQPNDLHEDKQALQVIQVLLCTSVAIQKATMIPA